MSFLAKVTGGKGCSVTPYSSGFFPTGECTVQAKRWKKPLWMQSFSNNWRTYSSASTVSCTVCVGKPYIRYACTSTPASVKARVTRAT
ncbi:hypothetical protein D3C86_1407670 [compost metagenome]